MKKKITVQNKGLWGIFFLMLRLKNSSLNTIVKWPDIINLFLYELTNIRIFEFLKSIIKYVSDSLPRSVDTKQISYNCAYVTLRILQFLHIYRFILVLEVEGLWNYTIENCVVFKHFIPLGIKVFVLMIPSIFYVFYVKRILE
jgi:hypothetical protein